MCLCGRVASNSCHVMKMRACIIFSEKDPLHFVYFMVQIEYYRSNRVQTTTSFKILNDVAVCRLLDLGNKILSMK